MPFPAEKILSKLVDKIKCRCNTHTKKYRQIENLLLFKSQLKIWLPHTILSIGPRIILYKAKSTRRFLIFIQAHDHSTDIAASRIQLIDLFFCCIKWQISYIKRRCRPKLFLLLASWPLKEIKSVNAIAINNV